MTSRAAVDTIKGYFYQFDLAILKLLQLPNELDEITLEGIEDIDLNADEETAIQCKYHSKSDYNHSLLAKPIRLMLNHYKTVIDGKKKKIKYAYYGHFQTGQSKLTFPITLDFLKSNLLTYTKDKTEHKHHEELNLSDKELIEFLKNLTIDINAKEYNQQLKDIYACIKSEVDTTCDDFEAENFYYNNALKIVSNLAKEDNIFNRKKSKKDFLKEINNKQVLFHKWFVKFRGKTKLLLDLRQKYFTSLNISPFERFFLIEVNPGPYIKNDIKNIVFLISKKWGDIKSTKNPSTFCPYIYIHGVTSEQLTELKEELAFEAFKFKDGFDFNGAKFNVNSIIEKATYHNQIRIKIIDELSYIDSILSIVSKTKEIYQFYIDKPYFITDNKSVKKVNIQVEELDDIKSII